MADSIRTLGRAPCVLIDDSLAPDGKSYLFENPQEIICCTEADNAFEAIERIAWGTQQGFYAAGFLSYELGYLLEPKLRAHLPEKRPHPLIWMGLFDEVRELGPKETRAWLKKEPHSDYRLEGLELSWSEERYLEAFERVIDYIKAGDVYQINLTLKYLFDFTGDPIDLYCELRRKQRVHYGAFIETEEFALLSLSPELFLEVENGIARARPMKGTAQRGRTPEEDRSFCEWLRSDAKSRAENLMIVDLLRNDLGRSSLIGSVEVTDLFTIERYPTLLQMTSGITAKLRPQTSFGDLLSSLFPCGSITGAPKVRAMEIIRELEDQPRGVYTGSIGMIAPSGNLSFNVAIRSLWLERNGTSAQYKGEMGIGSGVVYDSDGEAEYRECLLKAAFLTKPARDFKLIETFRWEKGDYWLLSQHLDRVEESADHFLFTVSRGGLAKALQDATCQFDDQECYRVRLTLSPDGEIEITSQVMIPPSPDTRYRYSLSDKKIDTKNPFLYHKTTRRELYDEEHKRLSAATGCDEVFFVNERGELAEGSRSNVFILKNGILLTPPISSGVLPGTLRRALLEDPSRPAREETLYPNDLKEAQAVYLGNSVRGLVRVEPV